MAFAYVKVPDPPKGVKILQGDRIETPEFIKVNQKLIDYRFYLTNQVMKPVLQIFDLKRDEIKIENLFMKPLMEYDRKMSGTRDISEWVCKHSDAYQARYRNEFDKIYQEAKIEAKKDPDIKAGDELYGDNN